MIRGLSDWKSKAPTAKGAKAALRARRSHLHITEDALDGETALAVRCVSLERGHSNWGVGGSGGGSEPEGAGGGWGGVGSATAATGAG